MQGAITLGMLVSCREGAVGFGGSFLLSMGLLLFVLCCAAAIERHFDRIERRDEERQREENRK